MSKRPIFIWVIDQLSTPLKTLVNYNNDIITSNGFELRFWDIRGLHKNWLKQNEYFEDTDVRIAITRLNNLLDIKQEIIQLKSECLDIFLLMSGKISFWNRPFIKLIEDQKITYGVRRNRASFYDATIGRNSSKKAITSITKKIINNLYTANIVGELIKLGIKGPQYLFLGTKHDLAQINFPLKRSQFVYTHTKDYDLILTSQMDEYGESDYFVYVDQYLPYHLETIHFKIDPDLFYKKIIQVLEKISSLTNKVFIVTAHPSADPNIMSKHFPYHQVYFNKTLALVRNSDFAVTINSSASLGAVTLGKRLIILKSELFPKIFNEITSELASLLGLPILDIDQELEKLNIDYCLKVGTSKYKDIYKNYVKQEGTPDIPEFKIICQHILDYFKTPPFDR